MNSRLQIRMIYVDMTWRLKHDFGSTSKYFQRNIFRINKMLVGDI